MSFIQTTYINALLAGASYVESLRIGAIDAGDFEKRPNEIPATYLPVNFTVLSRQNKDADTFVNRMFFFSVGGPALSLEHSLKNTFTVDRLWGDNGDDYVWGQNLLIRIDKDDVTRVCRSVRHGGGYLRRSLKRLSHNSKWGWVIKNSPINQELSHA